MSGLKHGFFRVGFMLCDRCVVNAKCKSFKPEGECVLEKKAFERIVLDLMEQYELEGVADRILAERAAMYLVRIARAEAYESAVGVTEKSSLWGDYISRLDNTLRGLLMSANNIFLGTSGWSYREWEGAFYRKGEKNKLRAYSQVFQTVEIDSTWYRYPSKRMVMGWLRYSPSDFVFAAKIPKLITHEKKLGLEGHVQADLDAFLDLMQPLQLDGKLACLLIQLPPSYEYNLENLESFFQKLQPQFKFAVEFRNLSWMRDETWQLLKNYGVAYANVDEPLLPPEVYLTADFAYFRWHGRGKRPWFNYKYKKEELEPWVPKIEEASKRVKKVFGYFNNHFHGYAPENCLHPIERSGLLTEKQGKAKEKISEKQAGLTSFFR